MRYLTILLGLLISGMASAHDPSGKYKEWFERQYNMGGGSCCGLGDSFYLDEDEWRSGGGKYQVYIEGHWYNIAHDRMLDPKKGGPNPTAKPVVWYAHDDRGEIIIYCFSPSWEA